MNVNYNYVYDEVTDRWVPMPAGGGGGSTATNVVLSTPSGTALYQLNPLTLTYAIPANQRVQVVTSIGAGFIPGSSTTIAEFTGMTSDADAQVAALGNNTIFSGTVARLQGFNGTTFDRLRSFAGNADAVVAPTLGLLGQVAFNFGFNGTTYDRVRSFPNNADNVANVTSGLLGTASYLYGYDGATWDRLISASTNVDTVGVATQGVLASCSFGFVFDGTQYERWRGQSSTNVALATQIGVGISAPPGNWSILHTPAANTQATISRAAVASTRHICTSISAVLIAPAAVVSGTVQLNLRDGATGAGTILWSQTLLVGGATSISADRAIIQLSGLQIPGSVNTAMTLEFSAAGGVSTLESVTLNGYDVS